MKKHIKKQRKSKINKRRDQETKPEHAQPEYTLCSEDWRDVVITYVPDLNNIPIEENYAEIMQEKIKDAFLKYGKRRKPHNRRRRK